MSRVDIVWSMVAAVYLTLALQHLLMWLRRRESWTHLLFSVTAVATAGIAAAELAMMKAQTVAAFGAALRWYHVPVWVFVLSVVGFVRHYLGTGRPWLALCVCVLRTLCLVINFSSAPNLNFLEPVRLHSLQLLGEPISIGVGPMNPWMLLGQLSLLLLIVFVLDALIAAWRRGDQRRALLVGGSIVLCVTAANCVSALAVAGALALPVTSSLFYLGIAAAMSFQLSEDLLRVVRLDRELRESQQQLRLAAAAARMELWVWDVENDDVWMTAEDRAALGVAPGERLDLRRLLDTIHPEDRPALEGAIRQSLQQGCEFDREYRRLLPGGTVRWFAASGQVERSPDGRPLRMCGVSLDVTQRIAAELDAQRHRNELARLGRVHLLGALSGAVAHELNQPLTAILSNAQAAQRFLAGPAPDLHEVGLILRDIVADQQRAGEIIRRLRGLLEKGESQRQPLDLNEVIQEVLRLLRSDLWHRQVVVHSSLAPELPLLYGDRVQMQQVLINLILNGCDAMQDNPPGERTLRVSTSLDGGEEPRIKICVADQGPGVATEQRESIFLPFFTTKAHGMGMGLAVCRVIITAHHGELWVDAAAGGGALFCFSMPALRTQGSGHGRAGLSD